MSFLRNAQNNSVGIGAANVTTLPGYQNPLYNYFGIGGIVPRMKWQVTEPEQFWLNQSLVVIGLPGVNNGTFRAQGLIDTRNAVPTG
jgi:hypothetical protein